MNAIMNARIWALKEKIGSFSAAKEPITDCDDVKALYIA